MRSKKLLVAFILSSIFTLLIGFLANLAATYLAPALASWSTFVYGALILIFIISLPVSYYLLIQTTSSSGSTPPEPKGPQITQTAEKGQIIRSPIAVAKDSNARVEQLSKNKGKIDKSDITIE